MLVMPFVMLSLALYFVYRGMRGAAIASWSVSLVLVLVNFKLHATDALRLVW